MAKVNEIPLDILVGSDVAHAEAEKVLNAVPDGWAKVGGEWVRVFPAEQWDLLTDDDRTVLVTEAKD